MMLWLDAEGGAHHCRPSRECLQSCSCSRKVDAGYLGGLEVVFQSSGGVWSCSFLARLVCGGGAVQMQCWGRGLQGALRQGLGV
jgi:hypothetical protein